MTQDFYKNKIEERGIEVMVPNNEDIEIVNDIIYNELVLGNIKEDSKETYIRIINQLEDEGVEGVILECTEIGLLIEQKHVSLPTFDTTEIHAYTEAMHVISEA